MLSEMDTTTQREMAIDLTVSAAQTGLARL